jgi:aspartyl-tRNA synthetase
VITGIAGVSSITQLRVEKVVTIVNWVKGMREMGCVTYLRKRDDELARH